MKITKTLSFIFILCFIIACNNFEEDLNKRSLQNLSEDFNLSENNFPTSSLISHKEPSLSEENSAILFQACTVFQKSRTCFKKSSNPIGALSCANKWEDPNRTQKQKLIEHNFISQEEYDASKAIYNEQRQTCKEKSKKEGIWVFDRKLIEYRCFRPLALAYMDSIIERFNCESIAPLTDSI